MAPDISTPASEQPEAELSISEHEAQFGKRLVADLSSSADEPQSDTNAAGPESLTSTDLQDRARDDQGRFQKGERQRAKSQHATREDVPRIQNLTRRLRDAEAERDRFKAEAELRSKAETTPQPIAEPSSLAPATAVATQPAHIIPFGSTVDSEPLTDDTNSDGTPKYTTYEDYLKAVRAYDKRIILNEWREEQRKEAAVREQNAHDQQEQQRIALAFQARVPTARERHSDFDEFAFNRPTKIPKDSLIDHWILNHAAGVEMLYHLQKNDAEVDRLLAMPMLDQIDTLSLLGQRLLSLSDQRNVQTGAVAARPIAIAPRPPTPVRTGPLRTPDEPPDEDASLAEHERFYGRSRARVR